MHLRDPIHALIALEAPEDDLAVALVDAAEVQRLRRGRHRGVTWLAFHGAEHTRFSHGVGTAFGMTLLLASLRADAGALPIPDLRSPGVVRDAVAAALVHDLGHGPFSHLFEEALPGARNRED